MEENNEKIQKYLQDYIKENRDTYTPDVIRFKLLDAGYDHHEIRKAFEALNIVPERVLNSREGDWRNAPMNIVGFLIFFPIIPIVTYVGALALNEPACISLSYLLTLLAGFFVPMYVKHRNPSMAKGMIYGFRTLLVLFIVLPIIAAVVLFGICMVMLMTSSY